MSWKGDKKSIRAAYLWHDVDDACGEEDASAVAEQARQERPATLLSPQPLLIEE